MKTLPIHAVAHVFLLRADSVLLLRRFKTGFNDGEYGLPGGHLNGNEGIKQAAIRECREEIGVEIEPDDLKVVGVAHHFSQTQEGIVFFLCTTRWMGEPYPRSECDELRWCLTRDLPEQTVYYVRRAIEQHLHSGEWFDEVF